MKVENNPELLKKYIKVVAKFLEIKNIPELKFEESTEYNGTYSLSKNWIVLTTQWKINDNFYRNNRLYNPFMTIGHELIHAKQSELGDLKYDGELTFYKDNVYTLMDRWLSPAAMLHEVEARQQENDVFNTCFPKFRDKYLTKIT